MIADATLAACWNAVCCWQHTAKHERCWFCACGFMRALLVKQTHLLLIVLLVK